MAALAGQSDAHSQSDGVLSRTFAAGLVAGRGTAGIYMAGCVGAERADRWAGGLSHPSSADFLLFSPALPIQPAQQLPGAHLRLPVSCFSPALHPPARQASMVPR